MKALVGKISIKVYENVLLRIVAFCCLDVFDWGKKWNKFTRWSFLDCELVKICNF